MRYLVIEGESVASVSERLGVSANVLYKWKSLYLEASEESSPKEQLSMKDLAAENELLRKKLRRSERINEILKKTVGYFSQDEL